MSLIGLGADAFLSLHPEFDGSFILCRRLVNRPLGTQVDEKSMLDIVIPLVDVNSAFPGPGCGGEEVVVESRKHPVLMS